MDSVFAQTYKDWEIIFWDNASRDASAEIAASYGDRVRIFRSDKTRPLGEVRNRAIAEARGKYLAFLDSDDVWFPEKTARQVAMLEENTRLGFVYCDAIDYFEEDGTSQSHFSQLGGTPPRQNAFSHLLRHYPIALSSAIIRASSLRDQPEWFDTRFNICEDYDVFLRLAYEWETAYILEPMLTYRVHPNSCSTIFEADNSREQVETIEKLISRHAEIRDRFADEIASICRDLPFKRGKFLWRTGRVREARAAFRAGLSSPKILAAYLASFILPYGLVFRTYRTIKHCVRR